MIGFIDTFLYSQFQELTINDCLRLVHSGWTTTVFSSSHSTVTDLVLVYGSLTSSLRMKYG
jgi:hypothetical protein